MDILDDMGVSKLSTKVFSKVNYSFKLLWIVSVFKPKQTRSIGKKNGPFKIWVAF